MSCNSCSNITLPQGASGAQGASGTNGTDGSNGIFGGYSLEWEFDDGISPSVPTTKIRLNNAAYASVTEIYIHENNIDSVDSTAFLASFDDTGDVNNHGYIRLFKQHDSTKFWLGKVKSVTDNGSDFTVDVEYILHNGAFSALDDVVVSFVANGANGLDGATKSGVIHNYSILDDANGNKTGTAIKGQLMTTFNIPVNTFESNMDEVTIKGGFSGNSLEWGLGKYYRFNIEIDGQDMIDPFYAIGEPSTFVNYYNSSGGSFEIKLYKTASQKLRPVILYKNNYTTQQPLETIAVSEAIAANSSILISQYLPNIANVSLPEITCPSVFASNALTVNIYMSSTTGGHVGDGKIPEFRVMNLHASYNKI